MLQQQVDMTTAGENKCKKEFLRKYYGLHKKHNKDDNIYESSQT